jgi:hypothetical protein
VGAASERRTRAGGVGAASERRTWAGGDAGGRRGGGERAADAVEALIVVK